MKDVLKVLAGVLLGLGLFLAGFLTGRSVGRHENDPRPLPDPQVIHEDVTIEVRPQLIASGTLRETVTVHVHDTIHDLNLDAVLPREYRVYADTSYRAVVSGIDPRLDSLSIREVHETILQPYEVTRWKEHSRWGLSVQGGYGIGSGGLTPYIGVGVSYRLLDF